MSTATLGLQPAVPVTPPDEHLQLAMSDVKFLIEDSIRTQPRSLQKRIGPSELGNPCDHCLAARLAGWEQIEPTVGWLPFIGTCVHAYYEDLFTRANSEAGEGKNWFLTERTVTVGQLDGVDVTGSTDLYLTPEFTCAGGGMTVDWKIVGKTTLDEAKRHQSPSPQYVAQAMLYARGWNAAGYPTTHVCVYFQPRNAMSLDDGYIWIAPYDEQVAIDTLNRAQTMLNSVNALAAVSPQVRDNWITSLPRAQACWDCKKYSDYGHTPGASQLANALNQ